MEIRKILDELREKKKQAEEIEAILSSTRKLWGVVKKELAEIGEKYGGRRRTKNRRARAIRARRFRCSLCGCPKCPSSAVQANSVQGCAVSRTGSAPAVDPTDANVAYAGGGGQMVYKTTDGGATFTAIPVLLSFFNGTVTRLAVDPSDPSVVLAGVEGGLLPGIYRSTDGGFGWSFSRTTTATGFAFAAGPPPPCQIVFRLPVAAVLNTATCCSVWAS